MQTATQVNPIEIINTVNSFYEVAWNHLLWFVGVAGAIIGVIVPFLIQLYQRRLFKVEEAEINKKVDTRLGDLKIEMTNFLAEQLKQEMQVFDKKLEAKEAALKKRIDTAHGAVFHVQGNMQQDQKFYAVALSSYFSAADWQIESADELNLKRVLKQILKCLQNTTKDQLTKFDDIPNDLEKLISKLMDNNENGRYTDVVRDLRKELDAAKNRNPPPPPGSK